jgi:hypothetical protein
MQGELNVLDHPPAHLDVALRVNKTGLAVAVVGKFVALIEYAQDLQFIVFDAIDHRKRCSRMRTVTRIFLTVL